MLKIEDSLIKFIDETPNAYYSTENIKKILTQSGFIELFENESWDNLKEEGEYFTIRNDSSLIAFKMAPKDKKLGFNIVSAHGDSPSFSIKPNADIFDGNYMKLNISGYGRMLNYSWLDRPLSIAGRVVILNDRTYEKRLINIDKDLLVIPSQAIHINEMANEKNKLNHQTDMLPIISLTGDKSLENIIKENLPKWDVNVAKICDYDLYLYNRDKGKYIGLNEEMISSPRLDDLAPLFISLMSFLESKNSNTICVLCTFNNEEIGNLTMQGADSTFLIDTLRRIAGFLKMDILPMLSNTFLVSADNAHALHPNAQNKNDPTNTVLLNKGVAIKYDINYTTEAVTSSVFKGLCDNAGVPYQNYVSRSDMNTGTTLGGVSQSHVGVDSVDVGLPQLAMHSANEIIGSKDVNYLYKALLEFYNSKIIKEKHNFKILSK